MKLNDSFVFGNERQVRRTVCWLEFLLVDDESAFVRRRLKGSRKVTDSSWA